MHGANQHRKTAAKEVKQEQVDAGIPSEKIYVDMPAMQISDHSGNHEG